MSHHAPNPAPPWPPNTSSSNGQAPPSVPGLNPQHLLSSQSSFEYNRTAIPGLSFAGSSQSWAADATGPSSQPTGPALSAQQPNVNPKPSAPAAPVNIHAPITMEDDMMEEGELSESGFEDLYEPYLDPVEENNTAEGPSQEHSADDEDYDPANPGSPVVSRAARAPWSDEPLAAESPDEVRERSRSYSPYLSPHEVETQGSAASGVAVNNTGSATQLQAPHVEDGQDANIPSSDNLPDARKKAQAAILRLWPLEVRYQDYLEEGIDEKVVHALFAGLGLDTKSAKANHNEQPQVLPPPETRASNSQAAQPTSPTHAAGSTVTAVIEAPQPAPAVSSEERKDRIARRLMAAKAAKQVSPGDTSQTLSTEAATHPSTSSESKTTAVSSQKKAEKERLLQEKLAKLQQSRALRAQKASEKASAASQTAVQEPSSVHLPRQDLTILPPAATHSTAEASTSQETGPAEEAPLQPAPPIPGLFLSSSGSPLVNPRKRPVASDLNETSAAPPYKRTFNQNYVEKPLIINVSDGSDDEDIEMDMSSPVDGPAAENSLANSAPPKSSSFRDHPPLTDKQNRRGLHSPASRTPNGAVAKDQDKAKLGHLTQNISELKQKIAEMQRQKGKTTPKDSPAQSSNGTPAVETQQPLGTDKAPTRSHSAGSSAAELQVSPAPAEPDIQRPLPKVRRASSGRGLERHQRVRVVSDQLPTFDASIARLDAKTRLFESQAARSRKEAEDIRAQRDQAYEELRRLQAEESASPEPEQARFPEPEQAQFPEPEQAQFPEPEQAQFPEPEQAQFPNGQQTSDEHVFSPSGDRDNLAAPTASPSDNPSNSREAADIPAISGFSRPETDDAEDRSEVPLPDVDSMPPVRSQAFKTMEEVTNESGEVVKPVEDTVMDEPPLAEEPQQTSDTTSQSPDEAMHIDTVSDGDEAYNPPEPSTEQEADAQRLQAEILSPALADDSTPPILANADSQESGTESAALPEHISKGVSDAADDDLDLPAQSETPAETSRTGFVPYESILKGFLSYRFHPDFHEDVAGGLRSPTYSNKINPQVQFCLDFLVGTCQRGGSCKYQHIDAVGLSESQTLLQLGNSERLHGKAYEAYVSGLRSLLAEFKAKQCKDFDAISQAIIDYRSRFYGDRSRVLPLGDVGL